MADNVPTAETSDAQPAKRRKVGFYCAVAECNSMHGKGSTLHSFPSDQVTRRQWIKFVQTCRADFGPSFGTPNNNSKICSKHFTADCYPAKIALAESFGIKSKKILNAYSVPTIQKPNRLAPNTASTVTTSSATVTAVSAANSSVTQVTMAVTSPICTTSVAPRQSLKARGAFAKRERQRVLADILAAGTSVSEPPEQTEQGCCDDTLEVNKTNTPVSLHASTQTEMPAITMKRNKKVQVRTKAMIKGVQCNMMDVKRPSTNQTTQCNLDLDQSYQNTVPPVEAVFSESEDPMSSDPIDPEDDTDELYLPGDDETVSLHHSEDEFETEREQHTSTSGTGRKFLVFEEALLQLFQNCSKCASPAQHSINVRGTMVKIKQDCPHCQNTWDWTSQPFIRDIPAGNLLMSAAILFSGNLPTKVLRFLHHMGVASISPYTFFAHQRAFLHPCVEEEWETWQHNYIAFARERQQTLTLGGDGRANSPGHCAKYGTYSLLDLDLMQVVDVRTVQSNEVGNSCRMEKEGLQRAVEFLRGQGLSIGEMVTDRHPMIIKFIREEMGETKHSIDVWHVGKGLKKKLLKLANQKECEALSAWIKSIINHLYWVAVSTPEGDGDVMLGKWLSLCNHIHNVHTHDQPSFPACQHDLITGEEGRKKRWIKEGSKLSAQLLDLLDTNQMRKDIPMLSTGPQTAAIEGFHSVLNHFAPKMIGFSYHGILHRTMIAALHYNENCNRDQAVDQTGKERFRLGFKKSKKDYSVQEVKVDCTYGYVERLTKRVLQKASDHSIMDMEQYIKEQREIQPAPQPLCTQYAKPDLEEAVRTHKSRYKQF